MLTVTGVRHTLRAEHFGLLKSNVLLANAGHFWDEIDVASLTAAAVERKELRANVEGFRLLDGRWLNLLGGGNIVNISCADGHPAEIMDMSFALQALAARYVVERSGSLGAGLLPRSSRDRRARGATEARRGRDLDRRADDGSTGIPRTLASVMKLLIRGSTVVTVDAKDAVLEGADLAIVDDKIVSVGSAPEGFVPDRVLDGRDRIVLPGLINTHTHLSMTLMRNYADDLAFWPWLLERIKPLEDRPRAGRRSHRRTPRNCRADSRRHDLFPRHVLSPRATSPTRLRARACERGSAGRCSTTRGKARRCCAPP